MPVHDWTRVDAGLFHAFHQSWSVYLCDAREPETAAWSSATSWFGGGTLVRYTS
jgi:hypothetical protein